ncbi:MAG: sodium/proton antiporter, partial [Gammaproteobacteria bacterium]|nr:sodium/proton antiporter [Gammaproteobacteria bacterium]
FMQDLLLAVFTRLLLSIRKKWLLSLLFCAAAAVLSAFLDALTVIAVLITVCAGFYAVYHASISSAGTPAPDSQELEEFRAFLRSLMMHAAVGTAIGGVTTLVGEPQNLLIGMTVGWHFMQFLRAMAPVSASVAAAGLVLVVVLEKTRLFGYGAELPEVVRQVLQQHAQSSGDGERDWKRPLVLMLQALAGILLILALTLHVAEVGLVGLAILVLLTSLTGINDERRIAHAFQEAMPFTALLVVFFAIVAVIQQSNLFTPIIHWVLGFEGRLQLTLLYAVNGLLSSVSDNVFVASVYIKQVQDAFLAHAISREQLESFALAINVGTNIPSVATPNGQAAFLFLLTSGVAPLIRLSYIRMLWMALPYTVVLTATGLIALLFIVS